MELSRISTLPRQDYPADIYAGGSPRDIEFWGSLKTPTGEVGSGEHGFESNWVCLGKFTQPKRSGYNADGSVGNVTEEDRLYFREQTEYEMNDALYPHAYDRIRYLRVVVVSTFASWEMPDATTTTLQWGEVTPYGQVNEYEKEYIHGAYYFYHSFHPCLLRRAGRNLQGVDQGGRLRLSSQSHKHDLSARLSEDYSHVGKADGSRRQESYPVYYAKSRDIDYGDFADGKVTIVVDSLEDRSYTFDVVNFDGEDNKSLPAEMTIFPYGDSWLISRSERAVVSAIMDGDDAKIEMTKATDEMVHPEAWHQRDHSAWCFEREAFRIFIGILSFVRTRHRVAPLDDFQ